MSAVCSKETSRQRYLQITQKQDEDFKCQRGYIDFLHKDARMGQQCKQRRKLQGRKNVV